LHTQLDKRSQGSPLHTEQLGIAPGSLDVALSLPSNEAVRSAVIDSPFASAMSELVVASDLRVGLLAQANLQLPTRSFSMLRHPSRHRSRAVLAFEGSLCSST
jgi:DNA-binding transcriptional LysR family regulator